MIERQIGNSYPVDGESWAHGKATDYEIIFEYDDIYTQLVDTLIDDPYATTIMLGEATEDIAQFLGVDYEEYLRTKCDEILIDDDYGDSKHFNCVEDCITDLAQDDLEMQFEWTEMI